MVLLGDVAQVDACFGPFGDSASLDGTLVHGLGQTYHRLENHFGFEIIVDTPDRTSRCCGPCEISFWSI
jgi:hypothetical protein